MPQRRTCMARTASGLCMAPETCSSLTVQSCVRTNPRFPAKKLQTYCISSPFYFWILPRSCHCCFVCACQKICWLLIQQERDFCWNIDVFWNSKLFAVCFKNKVDFHNFRLSLINLWEFHGTCWASHLFRDGVLGGKLVKDNIDFTFIVNIVNNHHMVACSAETSYSLHNGCNQVGHSHFA